MGGGEMGGADGKMAARVINEVAFGGAIAGACSGRQIGGRGSNDRLLLLLCY